MIQASEDLEDRESLAQIAASQNEQGTSDGETYIEKYIKGVSAVDSILALDRLRQVKYILFVVYGLCLYHWWINHTICSDLKKNICIFSQ